MLISSALNEQLICVFAFAYAKIWLSRDAAHMVSFLDEKRLKGTCKTAFTQGPLSQGPDRDLLLHCFYTKMPLHIYKNTAILIYMSEYLGKLTHISLASY